MYHIHSNIGKNLETTLGLFYEGRSGSPFSFLYYTSSSFKFDNAVVQNVKVKDANNDNYWGNDLAYIPANQLGKDEGS